MGLVEVRVESCTFLVSFLTRFPYLHLGKGATGQDPDKETIRKGINERIVMSPEVRVQVRPAHLDVVTLWNFITNQGTEPERGRCHPLKSTNHGTLR